MVRDFTWRTTRDRDENWAENVEVDADDLKHVWFMVDHFHSLKGLAHTYLTFEFGDGTCLSFSFETRREKTSATIRGMGCGVPTNFISWLGLSET